MKPLLALSMLIGMEAAGITANKPDQPTPSAGIYQPCLFSLLYATKFLKAVLLGHGTPKSLHVEFAIQF